MSICSVLALVITRFLFMHQAEVHTKRQRARGPTYKVIWWMYVATIRNKLIHDIRLDSIQFRIVYCLFLTFKSQQKNCAVYFIGKETRLSRSAVPFLNFVYECYRTQSKSFESTNVIEIVYRLGHTKVTRRQKPSIILYNDNDTTTMLEQQPTLPTGF